MYNEPINTLDMSQYTIESNQLPNITLTSLNKNESERNGNDSNNFQSNRSEDSGQNDDTRYLLDDRTIRANTGNKRIQQPLIFLENLFLLMETFNSFIGFKEIQSRLKGIYSIESSEEKKKEIEKYFKANIHKTIHNEFGKQIYNKFHGSTMIKVIKHDIFNVLINSINSILKEKKSMIILQKLNYKTFISDISKGNY